MKKTKIIWGIDPFEDDGPLLKKTLAVLKQLSAKTGLRVQPVYVVSPLELRIALEFSVPEKVRFQKLASQRMAGFLKKVSLSNLLPAKILIEKEPSVTATVKAFSKYASQEGSLVVVGTHAKKGAKRFFLGSFAETLLFALTVPVVLVNPAVKGDGLKKILFASDFSSKSNQGFERICELASRLKAGLTIYHSLSEPFGHLSVDIMNSVKTGERQAKKLADALVRKAKNKGISASAVVERTRLEKFEAILAQSQKIKADLLAMTAESGKMAVTFLGSTTRKVIREASLPVWVYRSK